VSSVWRVIPYVEIPTLELGPFEISIFGVLAAAGIWVGLELCLRRLRAAGIDPQPFEKSFSWVVIGGLYGAHWMHVLAYAPEMLESQGPLVLLKFWDGISSMGGVLGAVVTFLIWFRVHGLRLTPYLNAMALGAAPGWAVARLGCFAVHDHKGAHTDFFLAVAFPDGPRHDLGFYDMLVLLAIGALLWWLARRPVGQGVLMGVLAIVYSIARFFLDFLRATDVINADRRILGLTPAQYVTAGLILVGVWLIVRSRSLGAPGAAAAA
jgi:phosphatidylglycerol---prolipoprotein diacylglyceryl transferase